MIKDFVIPVNKDELLQRQIGKYNVKQIVPVGVIPQALDEARTALQTSGISFIFEHFDTFFSIIVHRNKIELPIVIRGFCRIHKALEILVVDMESIFEKQTTLNEEERLKFINVTKMVAYLFSLFVCYINDEILKDGSDKLSGKRKKSTRSDMEEEWEYTREKALEYVYRLLQLPLQKLWQPPIVEDSFTEILTKVCYKMIEQCTDSKQKHLRQTIFEILGTSVKRYHHGISCVVRMVQLVKLRDVLASHIGIGVVHMIDECGCNGLLREIIKEIDQSEPSESDCRNISAFLETIATAKPNLIIPILDDIIDYLSSEHYTMRICIINILGVIVEKILTGDELTQEQKNQRDECLNILEEHILDVNAYVRSKVLQIWQHLCCEGAIPLAKQGKLLAAVALRLEDKSTTVRKQALQLIRALVQGNPFAAKLNKVEISKSLEKEEITLRKLQAETVSRSTRGDSQRLELWNALLPKIREALKEVINGTKEGSDKRDDEDEESIDIDPNTAFEHVRQLMLKEKILKAVKFLWKVCIKLKENPEIENFSAEAKEECLLLLLLKTFMESENGPDNVQENADNRESLDKDKENIVGAKRVVNYLKHCLEFATELETAIPMAEKLLFSETASDAVEACTLLGTANQFGVVGATTAIRDALYQVFHRDPSVRNNIAEVYKSIYLVNNESQKAERQKALTCVKALIELLKSLQPNQSPALTQLVLTWYNNNDINSEVLQVLWEKFSMKSSDTNPLDSRTALMLITMIAQAESNIITGNLEVLIKVGLGPRAKTDLLLARDTCRALLKIKHKNDDIEKPPVRYPNDHEIFTKILTLLTENFTNMEEDGYVSLATDAISTIYHLANQPEYLIKKLLLEVYKRGQFDSDLPVPLLLLAKLLYVVGHIAIREMVHLDTSVYKELKRRDVIRQLRKEKNSNKKGKEFDRSRKSISTTTPSSARQMIRNKETPITEDNGEEAVEGAVEDADAEFINDVLENHVVTGDGLLSKFVPLVLDVCRYPDKYNSEDLQAAGALALSKMMLVSSIFCEESLQLLITILERSPYPNIRANVLIGISDLTTRFPNQILPWMKHVYGRLRDEHITVRRSCFRILSSLILKEMLRVRGQISELAVCIVDHDEQLRNDARQFFKVLSQKGNVLYNLMPDLLSHLTDSELNLNEADFHEILKIILNLLQKEKHVDSIIDKICARLKLATTERQWRDFAYCLSLLQFSAKSLRRLIESLPLLKEKIHHNQVSKALQSIIEQTKKKPNTKAISVELEEKMKELLQKTENSTQNDNEMMPPPQLIPKARKRSRRAASKRKSRGEKEDDDDEEEEEEEEEEENDDNDDGDDEMDNDSSISATPKGKKKEKSHELQSSSGSDESIESQRRSTVNPSTSTLRRSIRNKGIDLSSPRPKKNKQAVTPVCSPKRSSSRLSHSRN
ncbi:condensin complex subunit 1-like [Osmia bicornis bicornis]|uniref:condensin complex subunit 1-like n=1 Tax=Osmia bicornis bicornis TaxID=1437191 RepID=UPI001EAF1D94|nr:condensin complex subunit 1-like [Osmia bicornis bicornis]XP_029054483.2 condensin complex subunit 1-like [Osmia bicornis bicornis]XP_046144592.1 condensin complex subunit 1-like [Osmia bicornis bicornis]